MDLSKYKRAFDRFVAMGQKTRSDIYLKFGEDNDRTTPLISFSNQPTPCSSTQPMAPVSSIMEPIPEIEELELRERGKALREIIGPEPDELTIEHLIQNYNSNDAAINAYLDSQ